MKVYRGYDKKYGPITHPDWIYVTSDLEQAKWYALKNNSIKNGAVIEYEMPDNLDLLSINDVNNIMSKEGEEYTIDDLLWYQEGLSDYLYEYGQGIEFEDPKFKNHTIYIIFNERYLKNGKILNKKPLKEAYIKGDKGNIYYTKNSDMFLSIIKNTFISKNIPVRVYYDTIKQIYVFGNAFDYIHADLATNMKYYSKVYGVDEMRANISYLKQNCALFQVLPDDDLKKYDMGDGYTHGWILPYEDMFFACRNNEYKKVRDEVPLFKYKVGFWQGTEYYEHQKSQQVVNESVEDEFNSNVNCKVVLKDGRTIYGRFISKWEDNTGKGIFLKSSEANKIREDKIAELYIYYDCEVKLKDGRTIYGNFVGDYGDHKLHLDDAFNRKGWAIKDELIDKVNYKRVLKKELTESVEEKIFYIIRGVPGSGKSTLAHKLTDNVVEADQYFYDDEGNYNWSADKLNQAHNWCYNTVKKYMEEGRDKIAVANTFVKKRDYKRYVELAEQFGYKVDIRVCNGNFKNIHGVPDETVERMRAKFQLDESVLNDKVFYTRQLSKMLNICLNIGNARFIYIPKAKLYVMGDAHNNTHISLFISALNEGKFDIGENDIDEYFDEYINSAEDTGAIITKKYANDENIWLKSPDSTNVINDYGKFYLCNGLCIEESLAELTKSEPKYVKRKSYLDESIAYASKKDLSDVILKNPTRKELRDNHLVQCRCMEDSEGNWYFADMENMLHCYMVMALRDEAHFPLFNGNDYYGIAYYDAESNEFWYNLNDYMHRKECVEQYKNSEYLSTTFPNAKIIQNPWGDQGYDELYESVKYLNKEYSDTRIITSNYDMRDYLNNHKNLRIVYDKLNKCYFINDSEKAVHFNIMSDAIKAGFYNDYKVNSGIDLLLSNYYEQFVVFVVNDGSVPADVFDADDYIFEYKYDTFNIYDRDGQFINCPLYQILGMPNETNRIDGYNEDEDNENYYNEDEEEQLDESAENDKILREYAVKLANICLDALVKTKYETKIAGTQVQIDIDKAIKKAVPILKKSPYEYFILLVNKQEEPHASYGKTIDRKYGLITLPVFDGNPVDIMFDNLSKHKSIINKLYSSYQGHELSLKIGEYAIKYLKKEMQKKLPDVKSEYIDILIHECTHLLDDIRRTKSYKSKEQNLKDENGIDNYYNSPEEQNAFYQETVSIFDEWANQSVGYKTFDIFWDDFIRQYKGEYNMLNDKNKRKLKKRAYTYWYVYMKD